MHWISWPTSNPRFYPEDILFVEQHVPQVNNINPYSKIFDAGEALELQTLDLTSDEGWSEAMDGIDAVIHTASPFSAYEPKDEMELIGPARDGTLRVLNKAYASGIRKFVITSSTAAISGATPTTKNQTYTEQDWTDIDKDVSAYTKSKTLAEQAARDFASKHDDVQLTTVNPNVIFGPLHSGRSGTSLRIIESIVKSSYPSFPKISFAPVDVRDVAWMHAEALERDELEGERLMMASTQLRCHKLRGISNPMATRYVRWHCPTLLSR